MAASVDMLVSLCAAFLLFVILNRYATVQKFEFGENVLNSSRNPENKISFHQNMKQHNCFQYWWWRNVSWAENQYIRMISEESCDTED